ncbi:DNA translocase FtsK 4TM domain-containing protein, partial [Vibrio sp. FNV 38]|nr:DNA translocase FtsK 4TM domain-containing protein [Vibrio sp. FNV 38]
AKKTEKGKTKPKSKAGAKAAKRPAQRNSPAPAREPLLSESRRRVIRIVLGVLCGILTLYTLAALVSYVFTWTSDQSLSSDPEMFSMSSSAENMGGKIGYLWAELLISKWFGLGAFAIPVFLAYLTVY